MGGPRGSSTPRSARGAARMAAQERCKFDARELAGAETFEVGARDLAVDELDVAFAALFDQPYQRHLGSIPLLAPHRLAEKHPAELDAVKAADQALLPVGLDRMRESEPMQLLVGFDHLEVEPGFGARAARRGAGADR